MLCEIQYRACVCVLVVFVLVDCNLAVTYRCTVVACDRLSKLLSHRFSVKFLSMCSCRKHLCACFSCDSSPSWH